ncbi:hypothetical protein NP284_37250 [Rhodopseudomonas pseudopalustris]|uniref:hypothetical protein n=1 Tax=Rhodopseudomonas pseudopalustris TaxID=1513892 RepID=UPI003F95441E
MSEEAFALSPIAARPSLPSEADYDAIREAFMETSRGRWFLSEYAKRNRNADTRMVLDAVERIEQSIAAQKQSSQGGLMEALGPISSLIGETRNAVAKALPDPLEVLAPAREGARVTREVAVALRDCGADVRICDLLDAQVEAIESGHRQMVMSSARDVVLAAFDRLLQDVIDLASADGQPGADAAPSTTAATPRAEPPSPPAPPAAPEAAVAVQPVADEIVAEQIAADEIAAVIEHVPEPQPAAEAEAAAAAVIAATPAIDLDDEPEADDDSLFDEPEVSPQPAAQLAPEPPQDDEPPAPTLEQIIADEAVSDAAFAHDIAVLDLVAQEMAAPDDDDLSDLEFADPEPAEHAEPVAQADGVPAEAVAVSAPVQAIAAEPAATANASRASAQAPQQMQAAAPASVGAAVLAQGVVRKPVLSSDPFAALRRMTQAEKLAFFS